MKKKKILIFLLLFLVLALAVAFLGFSKLKYVFNPNYAEYKDYLAELPFFGKKEIDLSETQDFEVIRLFKDSFPDIALRYKISLPKIGEVESGVETLEFDSLSKSEFSKLTSLLRYLPNLREISIGNLGEGESFNLEELSSFRESFPDLKFNVQSLILGSLSAENFADLSSLFEYIPGIKELNLGNLGGDSSFKANDLLSLKSKYPETTFTGKYEFHGKVFDLTDSVVDINHIRLSDNGDEILALALCMPNLEFLDMDSCGIPNERMAEIRDALPNAKVVWRIWFGRDYTVRTDVETILASYSKPSSNILRNHNVQPLKYCRDVKNLDLGHNFITDISFISEMKNLEVCIIGLNSWSDLSPIANCTKIHYLEISDTQLDSLEALRGLKNLKNLNAANNRNLSDLSPLYDLDLDCFWLGCYHKVSKEQIWDFWHTFRDCEFNITTPDSMDQGWRADKRYYPIIDIFKYIQRPIPYSLYWLDPLVQPQDMVDRENFLKEMAEVGEYPEHELK